MAEQAGATKISQQAEQGSVLAKLIAFSLALAIVPISAYFGTQKFLTPDNTIYPAVAAVVAANIILAGYVIIAVMEDSGPKKIIETKKNQ